MRSKVTIVGVGNVGASCALWLAKRGIADLVLVDIPLAKTMPVGKGLDLLDRCRGLRIELCAHQPDVFLLMLQLIEQ